MQQPHCISVQQPRLTTGRGCCTSGQQPRPSGEVAVHSVCPRQEREDARGFQSRDRGCTTIPKLQRRGLPKVTVTTASGRKSTAAMIPGLESQEEVGGMTPAPRWTRTECGTEEGRRGGQGRGDLPMSTVGSWRSSHNLAAPVRRTPQVFTRSRQLRSASLRWVHPTRVWHA